MISVKDLKKIETLEDLENLGIGNVLYNISDRVGYLGFYSSDVARFFKIEEHYLPPKFGARCNYLGDRVREKIIASDFSSEIGKRKAKLLSELADACVRVYENVLNDEENKDEINWNALATDFEYIYSIIIG